MLENILAKARKLSALIAHPNTPKEEKENAIRFLQSLCDKHKISIEQIHSSERTERTIPIANKIDDDRLLTCQIIRVVTNSNDHPIYGQKIKKKYISVTSHLTDAEYVSVLDMLNHYRDIHLRILTKIDDDIAKLKRVRKQSMRGLIHRNNIIAPETGKEKTTSKKLTKQELNDLIAAMALATGTAYKPPTINLTQQP